MDTTTTDRLTPEAELRVVPREDPDHDRLAARQLEAIRALIEAAPRAETLTDNGLQ